MQNGSAEDLRAKLKVILDDEFKELKDQFRGSSFGLALRNGSAEDLRAKLKVILDDEFKELKDQFRGHSFGLALQNGSAEDLRAKLCYLKDINDKFRSHDKNNSYYLIIFIANLTRYFMGERRSASRDLEVTSRCLMDLDLSNLELNLLEASQGNKSQPKVDDINRLLTAEHGLSKDLANIVASFFAGNRAGIKNQQIQSLFRVLLGPQVNRRTTSISQGSIPEDYRPFLATQELGIEKVEIRDGLSRWILKHQLALPKYTLDHLVEVLVGSDVLDINIEEILDQRMKDHNLSAAELLDQLLALLYGVTDDS